MNYYIFKIEQISKNGVLSEYAGTEKFSTLQAAEVKYFKGLSDVAADIGKNHTYMYIEIKDSNGNIPEGHFARLGKYVEKEPDTNN